MSPSTVLFVPETRVLRAGWRIPYLLLWVTPLFIGTGVLHAKAASHLPHHLARSAQAILSLVLILSALGTYRLFARYVERRDPREIGFDGGTFRHVGLGFLLGGGAMLLITAILVASGCYRVAGLNSPWTLVKALFEYLPQSFLEDFLFGLVLYRLLREGLGGRTALVVVPLLFVLAHAANSHESPLGLAEIFTGGMLMYYAFERTGRFWTLWAMHFSWNFVMNGVLGMPNSGHAIAGFIRPALSGPIWLTGGRTGPEASVLAVGLDLLLLFLLTRMPDRWLRAHPMQSGLQA